MRTILLLLLISFSIQAQLLDYTRARHVTQYVSPMVYTSSPSSPVDNSPPSPALLTGSGVDFDSTRAQINGYAADCDTTRLLVKLNGYSTNRSDGTLIIAQSSGFLTDTTIYIAGLTQDTIAYWSLYQADSLNNWTVTRDTALIKTAYVPPDLTPPDSAANFLVTSDVKETIRIRSSDFPTDVDSIFGVTSPNTITTLAGLDTLFALIASDTSKLADSTFAYPVISDSTVNLVMQLQDAAGNEQNSTQWNKQSEIQVDSIGPPGGGGGGSWPAEITLFQTFENGANVDSGNGDFSISGDITATTNGSPTITTADEIFGAQAAAIGAASTWYNYDLSGGTFLTADHGKIGFSVRVDAIANGNTILNLYETGTSTGPDNRFSVTMNSGGNLGFEWDQDPTGTSNISTSGGTVSPGDTVFVVAWFDQSDGRRKVVIYDMQKNGLDSVDSDNALDAMSSWGSMQVGCVSPSGSPDIVVDNIILATDTTTDVLKYLDSLSYGGTGGGGPGPDITPPDSAASFVVFSPARDSITYDVDDYATDAVNVIANYKTGSYPSSRTDGTVQFNYSVADSNAYKDTTFFYDAPDDNTVLYWRVWHSDAAANWSTVALTNQDTVSVDSTGGPPVTPGPEGSSMFIITGLSGATKGITVNGNSIATQAVEQTTLYFKSDSTGGFVVQ